jgi:hypothetical protein
MKPPKHLVTPTKHVLDDRLGIEQSRYNMPIIHS